MKQNHDNVPDICKRIIDSDCGIRWYIRFGGNEPLIRQKIVEASMQEHVIILGRKENPYPYIKACDIYVQPSRYEVRSSQYSVRDLSVEKFIICKNDT